ncbi:hypothetical protein, partial [Streptomyces afghaniensis]|uniref:hypothetical protein n=1 Tax=Streptomyces afghaniensis TaxID=66865 RepID=UPI001427C49F
GMLDSEELAGGVDRFRERVLARFRDHEDVRLVLAPEQVLTPVLLRELSEAAAVGSLDRPLPRHVRADGPV